MNALLRKLTRRRPAAEHLKVQVYTRRKCCCCHKAMDILQRERKRHGFSIEILDVDTDPALVAAYGSSVPVVLIDGKVRFKGIVNPVLLDRLLTAEARRPRS